MSKPTTDYRNMVVLSAFLAPVLGGAIIYYSLKNTQVQIANLGNRMSWVALALWIVVGISGIVPEVWVSGGALPLLLTLLGVVLAVVAVVKIKKAARASGD